MMPRTFRARNMPAALEAMEKELGSDALIVSVRRHPAKRAWRKWHGTDVEVVAIPSAVAVQSPSACQTAISGSGGRNPIPLKEEEEKKLVQPAKKEPCGDSAKYPGAALKEGSPKTRKSSRADPGMPACLASLRERMLSQGVDSVLVDDLLQPIRKDEEPQTQWNEQLTYQKAELRLQARLRIDEHAVDQRIVCVIGVNGSGKSSLGAKVAAYAVRTLGRKVRWIAADTLRAGAIAKAQAYTAPLGVPLNLAYSPAELAALVGKAGEDELIMVDTPGCNPYRMDEITELKALLSILPSRYTLLVAPATSKEEDLQDTATVLLPLGVNGLAISKMDETLTFGGLYNFVCRNPVPISFFTAGPRIIGDLYPADPAILVNALLGRG